MSAAAGLVTTWLLSLVVVTTSGLPGPAAELTAVVVGVLVVSTGALLAPRRQLVATLAALMCGMTVSAALLGFHEVEMLVGGALVVPFAASWDRLQRAPHARALFNIGACFGIAALVGIGWARIVDVPARRDPLPPQLAHALGSKGSGVSFYVYDLGGFIDREWLWRLDARPEDVALVIRQLGLEHTQEIPSRFWTMPPRYWPRAGSSDRVAFKSPWFATEGRGRDGDHYFLVHDTSNNRAFVWVKENF